MKAKSQTFSIVSQSLDRSAFVAYFLGAVVPFVALAYVAVSFVLPELREELARAGMLALVLSIGVLSAAAFLLLRRVTMRTIGQLRTASDRVEALLDASVRLTSAPHEAEVASIAAVCAQRIAGAPAAFFVAAQPGAPPKLEAVAGDRALWPAVEARLGETLAQALQESRPVLWRGAGDAASGALVPVEGVGAIAVVTPHRVMAEGAILRPLATLAAQASIAARRVQLVEAQRNFFVHVTDMLVAALDTHMDLQAGHARRVAQLSNRIGRELGLDDARRQRLHFAALLHDVGMLRIDPSRMGDRKIARQHPQLGHRMLAPIQLWTEVAPLVLHHHEWFDGSGYPEQLAGEAIPLESRIIGLAEAFDSMTSESTYQASVPREEAVRRVEAGSGTQFDPAVVRVFLELERRGDLDVS